MTARSVHPSGPIYGAVRPPGSKSITNRALLIAALARGRSRLIGGLDADDTQVMRSGLGRFGAVVTEAPDGWLVEGSIADGAGRRDRHIDVRASGTTARFLTAAGALVSGRTTIDGTARMRQRPIGALVEALEAMGAEVVSIGAGGCPPVAIDGPTVLRGGDVAVDATTSSQFVSALMMIAPFAESPVTLRFKEGRAISRPYLATTAEVMAAFGVDVEVAEDHVTVAPGRYQSREFEIEPDASAAVYPWVAAAVTGGAVRVEGIRRSSTQADVRALDVLEAMGCRVHDGSAGLTVRGPDRLRAVDVDMNDCPDASLAIAVAALFAEGTSTIRNVASLRVKETDRLAALAAELAKLGASVSTTDDRISIVPGPLRGAEIDTYDDHRMAMAFALAGLVLEGVSIADPECVTKTWPAYFETIDRLVGHSHRIVAVDGPGGSGKTTVSRGVAERLGIGHLDTGAFYRAATVVALEAGVSPEDADAVVGVVEPREFRYQHGVMYVDGRNVNEAIRTEEVNASVSAVSAIPAVRAQMVSTQRRWIEQVGGRGVIEGRDIGTVVVPEAMLKVFLTASEGVRAARRAHEQGASVGQVADGLRRRDHLDSSRAASPLQEASDAVVVDTSTMTIDEVVDHVATMAGGAEAFRD